MIIGMVNAPGPQGRWKNDLKPSSSGKLLAVFPSYSGYHMDSLKCMCFVVLVSTIKFAEKNVSFLARLRSSKARFMVEGKGVGLGQLSYLSSNRSIKNAENVPMCGWETRGISQDLLGHLW